MTISKTKFTLLVLSNFIAASLTLASPALAGNLGPFWRVQGTKLGQGVSKALEGTNFFTQPKSMALYAEADNKVIEIECEDAPLVGKIWNGTQRGENEERIELKNNCAVFEVIITTKEGKEEKKVVKVNECAPKTPIVLEVASSLWFETKANGAMTEQTIKIRDVFAPTQKGGRVWGKVTLEGAGCGALEGVYSMEGSTAAIPSAEATEKVENFITFPTEQIKHIWQPTSQQAVESQIELKFDAKLANLAGEAKVVLSPRERFGFFRE